MKKDLGVQGATGKPGLGFLPTFFPLLLFQHLSIPASFISHVDVPWSHRKDKHYPSLPVPPGGSAEVGMIPRTKTVAARIKQT